MTDWYYPLASMIIGAMTALSLAGLTVALLSPVSDRWSKRYFIALFTSLVMLSGVWISDAVSLLFSTGIEFTKYLWICESALLSIPLPMFSAYMLHCCKEDFRKSILFRVVFVNWIIYFVEILAACFTDFFYDVAPDGSFIRGDWYLLVLAPLFIIVAANLAGVIRRRTKLSHKTFIAFLIHLLPLLVTIIYHAIFTDFLTVGIGFAISALAMLGVILFDQVEQSLNQQKEIARQRASILMLQMRPHFICNTMTSIYYLCDQDPQKAKQVTLDFTTYLRKNFTAVAGDKLIPFSEELAHARAYLAVEEAQFEDRLFVDYDTPHTHFSLPPLTLQPLVENAVKHGMDPDGEALRIVIRTRKTDAGSEVVVEDNGAGFEQPRDNEPHTALANIEQRLALMCGGSMTIAAREGGGTVVTVRVP